MKKLLFALFVILPLAAVSQDVKTKKALHSELSQATHNADASAPAAILLKKGITYFDFDKDGNWQVVTDVSVRLKIYNENGLKYGSAEIPVREKETVEFSDVVTYNLEGGKITESTVAENRLQNSKITFPNVRAGSIIEYRYILRSPHFTTLPTWYFQYDIPVNNIEYAVHIPHFFTYNRILSPYVKIDEKLETVRQARAHSTANSKGSVNRGNASAIQTQQGSVVFYEARKTYSAANVPALGDEKYVDNIKNYQSFVKHELASTQYPNEPKKDFTTNWEAVSKLIYNEQGFGEELARKGYFEKDVDAILAKSETQEETIAAIFNYVKNHMTWNNQYGYTAKNTLQKAYEMKSGNVAEINLMLIAMLRYAGLNASPVLLSTRDKGHVAFVNRDEFNYVIAGIESQNGIKFLDATSKNTLPGILPLRALNGTGRIIKENKSSEEVSLFPQTSSLESTSVTATLLPDGMVTGKVKTFYTDYNSYLFREGLSGQNRIETLEKEFKNINVTEHQLSINDDLTKPLMEDYNFETKIAEASQGKLFISPMLMYANTQNPFLQESRSYPVDFTYPQQHKYTFSISLPEGYGIESLPQSVYYQMKDNLGGYKFNISAVGQNQVQVVVVSNINYARVNPEYYSTLKDFYSNIINKQAEKIVLKKL